jgi:hypothetical protein
VLNTLLSFTLIATLLCAFWPGGKLFSLSGKEDSEEA